VPFDYYTYVIFQFIDDELGIKFIAHIQSDLQRPILTTNGYILYERYSNEKGIF
jgi:hypothetical protein